MKYSTGVVSIVMPVFNSERFLSAAIESVLCQTYGKWELLICDDRSVDGSWEIANTFADSDDRIFVFRNEYSKGASGARNTCIKRAKGQFLAFLDADDLWDDCKLAKQVAFVSETACCFTYCNYRLITEEDTVFGIVKSPSCISQNMMLITNWIGCLSVFLDRQKFDVVRQPDIARRNDYALWLQLWRSRPSMIAVGIPEVLASYRVNGYGLSSNKFANIKYYYYCIREHGGCGKVCAALLTLNYMLLIFIKKKFLSAYNEIVVRYVDRVFGAQVK